MEVNLSWRRFRPLHNGSRENLIYTTDLGELPETSGIYLFARRHGQSVHILYIGKALNLRARIKQQLNNARLMKAIENAPRGARILICAEVQLKRGQKIAKALDIAEKGFIRHFLTQGHDILNKQGTAIRQHIINSDRAEFKKCIPLQMFLDG
ncbi:MAG: hypothetical protein HYR56_02420 [Acidobacteria bacterium]|nr:hypothetical protein [Acidobacteriota bacterium]MBI3424825.1 hypothetical protein [Acidobacteriota bacterium]